MSSCTKHADRTLAGQRDQRLSLRTPFHIRGVESLADWFRPRLRALRVLIHNDATGSAGSQKLSGVVPGDARYRSADVDGLEGIQFPEIPHREHVLPLIG